MPAEFFLFTVVSASNLLNKSEALKNNFINDGLILIFSLFNEAKTFSSDWHIFSKSVRFTEREAPLSYEPHEKVLLYIL